MNWQHDRLKRPNPNRRRNQRERDVWTSQQYRRNQHQNWYSLLSCLNEVCSTRIGPAKRIRRENRCIDMFYIYVGPAAGPTIAQTFANIRCRLFTYIFIEFIDGCTYCALWHASTAHIEESVFCDGTLSATSGILDGFIVEWIGAKKCWPSRRLNAFWRKWPN